MHVKKMKRMVKGEEEEFTENENETKHPMKCISLALQELKDNSEASITSDDTHIECVRFKIYSIVF